MHGGQTVLNVGKNIVAAAVVVLCLFVCLFACFICLDTCLFFTRTFYFIKYQ